MRKFTIIYFGTSLLAIIALFANKDVIGDILRPLPILILLFHFYQNIIGSKSRSAFTNLNAIALVLSLIGDIFFVINQRDVTKWTFAAAVILYTCRNISLLLAYSWNTYKSEIMNPIWIKILAIILSIVGVFLLYLIIASVITNYKALIIFYYIFLGFLCISAGIRLNHTSFKSWWIAIIAVIVLLISDILFSLECFKMEEYKNALEESRLLIYYIALYLFIYACVEHVESYKIIQRHRIYTVIK